MFFTTLLIDVTPLEYNELNAGVRSHKTEDEWPQKCTVVINTGFTKKKKCQQERKKNLDSEQQSPRRTEKTKKRGRTPLFCEQFRHTQGSHKTGGLLFTNCRRCKWNVPSTEDGFCYDLWCVPMTYVQVLRSFSEAIYKCVCTGISFRLHGQCTKCNLTQDNLSPLTETETNC